VKQYFGKMLLIMSPNFRFQQMATKELKIFMLCKKGYRDSGYIKVQTKR
jgi:hypothetical protein